MAKIDLTNGAAPATPAAGKVSIYTKTDKKIYIKDDAGLETPLIDAGLASITALTGDVTATGPGSVVATIANSAVTNAKVAAGIDAVKIGAGSVDNTEFGYLNGVTSAIQTQLDAKVDENVAITGATKTKITYDAKGLVTSGADATTADIADSLNKRYVTDADLVDIGNLSGVNTGDQTITLTGEVTGSGTGSFATTVDKTSITNRTTVTPENGDQILFADASDSYNLKKMLVSGLGNVYVPYSGATADVVLGTRNIRMASGELRDAANLASVQVNNRALQTAGGINNVQWGTYQLVDSLSGLSQNWDTHQLYSINGIDVTVDYGNTTLNFGGFVVLDWQTGFINAGSGVLSIDINNRCLMDNAGFNIVLDWGNQYISDGSGVKAMDFSASQRQLFDFGGSYPSVDFGNYQLYNIGITNSVPLLDWSNGAGGGVKIYYGYNNVVVGDFTNQQLLHSGGIMTVDWNNYQLLDNYTSVSVDWNYHTLQLLGTTILDWQNGILYSTNGVTSLSWEGRGLLNQAGVQLLSWVTNSLAITGSSTTETGAIWTDTTQKALQVYQAGVRQSLQGVLFTQTATGTSANSTAENTISSTGVGTLTLPTNFFVAGKTLRITGKGFHSSTASPTLNLKVKFGSTVINTTGAHTHHNATNGYFDFECDITCRTTGAGGTVFSQGVFTDATDHVSMSNTATISVNTTTTQAITVTAQWSAAAVGNTISLTNLAVEVLN